jgi:acetolactate synthase-1/2/3 large subunit
VVRSWSPRAAHGFHPDTLAAALAALLPEGAIVSDESVTTGRGFFKQTAGAPPHDWMNNMGGSIGLGMPLATGAAIACPDRKVVCLEGDGSGMYTVQALWTQARESLNVTTVVFANRTYAILHGELANVARPVARRRTCSTSGAPISTSSRWPASVRKGFYRGIQQAARRVAAIGPYLIEAVV